MLTPEDIASRTFRKTLFGYDLEQVDAFLDEIIRDRQKLEEERKEMSALIATLTDRVYELEQAEKGGEA